MLLCSQAAWAGWGLLWKPLLPHRAHPKASSSALILHAGAITGVCGGGDGLCRGKRPRAFVLENVRGARLHGAHICATADVSLQCSCVAAGE